MVAIVPARLGSSRFPGKVLVELAGRSLLEHVVDAARQACRVDQVVVATTTKPEDDRLARHALDLGAEVFRGSEADVLDRLFGTAAAYQADVALRLTVDNPMVPSSLIDQVIERHLATGAEFTCTYLPPTFPDGFEVEALSFPTLARLHQHTRQPEDREHVTWYIRTHPEEFRIENVAAEEDLGRLRDISVSIDTPEDLERTRKFYGEVRRVFPARSKAAASVNGPGIGLCVPLSEVFERQADKILPLVEAISFKDPSDALFPGKKCLLESSLNLLDPCFPEQVAPLLPALSEEKYCSFALDLGPNCISWIMGDSPNQFPRYLPASEPLEEGALGENMQKNVTFLRRHFSGPLKVENLNYFPTGAYERVCEPEVIARLIRDSGVELLLDLGHALISAHNLGQEVEDYFSRLPLEWVKEVHLSRAGLVGGIWEDTHELPTRAEFELLDFIAARAPVELVTLEYYREDEGVVRGYRDLHGWASDRNGGLPAHE